MPSLSFVFELSFLPYFLIFGIPGDHPGVSRSYLDTFLPDSFTHNLRKGRNRFLWRCFLSEWRGGLKGARKWFRTLPVISDWLWVPWALYEDQWGVNNRSQMIGTFQGSHSIKRIHSPWEKLGSLLTLWHLFGKRSCKALEAMNIADARIFSWIDADGFD